MNKIMKICNDVKVFTCKHSPEILTGLGVGGMITSVVLAVKATPKAEQLLKEEMIRLNVDDFRFIDKVKICWKPYIPTILTVLASGACMISATSIGCKRNASLSAAFTLTKTAFDTYKDKVIETIGENKEKKIREEIAQDKVNETRDNQNQVIITSKGNTLCMDSISGRYFKSDIDIIKKVVNELNNEMLNYNYVSLSDFYNKLGLDHTKNSDNLGWNIDNGLIEIEFSACIASNDEPCIVLNYTIDPKDRFDMIY